MSSSIAPIRHPHRPPAAMIPRSHSNPADSSWAPTLRLCAAIFLCAAGVSAAYWIPAGSPELQMRIARSELSEVGTSEAFRSAHARLVDCSPPSSCVLGTTAARREAIFLAAASATGADRHRPQP